MTPARSLLRSFLGRRLPTTEGVMSVDGIRRPITVRRDSYGVPHIYADHSEDAWFGLGFVQGQDRSFQVDVLSRVVRGSVAALIGPDGVAVDRLARRIGFAAAGRAALACMEDEECAMLDAFSRGVNAGRERGLSARTHEHALLRSEPLVYQPSDATGLLALFGFMLASNWDMELARLKILELDGPDALAAVDAGYPEWHPVTTDPLSAAGPAAGGLLEDIARFGDVVPLGAASNNWALGADRTTTGRPLLANDTHLAPSLPTHYYLAHQITPTWAMAGASLAGAPVWVSGHNGHVAWGVTSGQIDNTDLFVEQIGQDGVSVREHDGFRPCEVRTEVIEVRGREDVIEEVLVTPRGPIVGPALPGSPAAISMAATWLEPTSASLLAHMVESKNVEGLRSAMAEYHGPGLNMVSADTSGNICWQMIGVAPVRKSGIGAFPLPAWDPEVGWEHERLPYAEMPGTTNPDIGWVATANNRPVAGDDARFGIDWIEGYRLMRIGAIVDDRSDWDIADTLQAQLDTVTPLWAELADHIMALRDRDDVAEIVTLFDGWDGDLAADAPQASLFVLWLKAMQVRLARAAAPNSWRYVLGLGFGAPPLNPYSLMGFTRSGHLVKVLRARPSGWFGSWDDEIAAALLESRGTLRATVGDKIEDWGWGSVRPLTLMHSFGTKRGLASIFNVGPIQIGGDMTTVAQAGAVPLDPLANPSAIANVRSAIDVGDWDRSRISLPGGQSGNPVSSHYSDQVEPWQTGSGIPLLWSREAVAADTTGTLHLVPS